ncbi:AraC family transcriptional regulator [Marinomonas sp. 15G1-11]|uniref:AraC family transcriptional regulator n=1 Tax=Marinomonas phaeophyticola TaxID=3004091 RepID=A0ABT4JQG0_9GAMM|nr:AraC family transcriptional regulator [Marinomonas sp. 15G1-11]MCZ2720257.1 AraC family transcriptional regulator [Marinomonas sp. 15G1-11]
MSNKIDEFNQLIKQNVQHEGVTPLAIEGVGVLQWSRPQARTPVLYEPLICMMGQGEKVCSVGESAFLYKKGDYFINFLPIPVRAEVTSASKEIPFLSAVMSINLVKLADMITRIERQEKNAINTEPENASCIIVGQASDDLMDLFIRLIKVGSNTTDAAILGDFVMDEIYYRLLTSEHGYALRQLLSQYGHIQPVSRAVNFIHDNVNASIQVEELASIANMSKTSFFNAFKKLMHVSPMQYIKSIKLQKAQILLKQGMQANEASFQVGYNSFSQFSREYKRFFGFPPSQTF